MICAIQLIEMVCGRYLLTEMAAQKRGDSELSRSGRTTITGLVLSPDGTEYTE